MPSALLAYLCLARPLPIWQRSFLRIKKQKPIGGSVQIVMKGGGDWRSFVGVFT